MKRQLMAAAAVCVLAFTAGCASTSAPADQKAEASRPAASAAEADYPITAQGATAFVADAEARLAEMAE